MCGSGAVVCSWSLLIRGAQRARHQAETPPIVLCRFPGPALTTVVGIVFFQNQSIWFNIGDSRLYQHHKDHLRQISIDDVPDSVKGHISGQGRQSHAITQALGGTKTIQPLAPHMGVNDLVAPSRWLLCSDGLTDMVDNDAIEKCMEAADLDAVLQLFNLAMVAGGEDNLSIIIASIN